MRQLRSKLLRLDSLTTAALITSTLGWVSLLVWLLGTDNPPKALSGSPSLVGHVGLFLGTGITVLALVYLHRRLLAIAVGVLMMGAIATELLQAEVLSTRDGSLEDIVADGFGVATGLLLLYVLVSMCPKGSLWPFRVVAAGSPLVLLVSVGAIASSHPDVTGENDCGKSQGKDISAGEGPVATVDIAASQFTVGDRLTQYQGKTVTDNFRDILCLAQESGEFTVVAKLRGVEAEATNAFTIVESDDGRKGSGPNFYVGQAGTSLFASALDSSFGQSPGIVVLDAVKVGEVHTVVLVATEKTAELWLDGKVVGKLPVRGTVLGSWRPGASLLVEGGGRLADGSDLTVSGSGSVGSIQFYDRVLSGPEMVNN